MGAFHARKRSGIDGYPSGSNGRRREFKYINGQNICADKHWFRYNPADESEGEPGWKSDEFYIGMVPPGNDIKDLGMHDFGDHSASHASLAICEYRCII